MPYEQLMRSQALEADKIDLIHILTDRFGSVPEDVLRKLEAISELDVMDRLFLVAVNAAEWSIFVTELNDGQHSFKIIGEDFNPLAKTVRRIND